MLLRERKVERFLVVLSEEQKYKNRHGLFEEMDENRIGSILQIRRDELTMLKLILKS